MGPVGIPELIMIFMIALLWGVFGVLPFWFICRKAGLSPWLSLIMLVPLGAMVLPFVMAFIEWPALRENKPPQIR